MIESVTLDALGINIEVAHLRSWHSAEARLSAEESLLIAQEYCNALDNPSLTPVLTILIDDKALQIGDRQHWLADAFARWPDIFESIDFLCFESDLSAIADLFIARLVTSNRGRRAREIERYRDKHGRIACSHDIAIWHSLRLGLLGRHDNLLQHGPHWRSGIAFYCSHVVSILEEEDREDEARAAEIMRESADSRRLRVETIFYAP